MILFLSLQRVRANLTPQQTEDAIEFLKRHPELYDKSDSEYYTKNFNDIITLLATELKISVERALVWYKSQRTMLLGAKKKTDKTGSGSVKPLAYQERIRYDRLAFMLPHVGVQVKHKELRPVSLTAKFSDSNVTILTCSNFMLLVI